MKVILRKSRAILKDFNSLEFIEVLLQSHYSVFKRLELHTTFKEGAPVYKFRVFDNKNLILMSTKSMKEALDRYNSIPNREPDSVDMEEITGVE